jgi:hypothetical protein
MVDTTVPHTARIWNYWLGGTNNFPADREFGDHVIELYPDIVNLARAARAFLGRAVGYLVGEAGIRQFLDVGSGLPTADNTHEIAQRVAPESRVVYADKDPLVLVHAAALLTSTPEGATTYIEADVRETEKILAATAETLDLARPVALMLLGVMGNIADIGEAYATVNRLVTALPSGSYLVLADGTISNENIRALNDGPAGVRYQNRDPEAIAGFFDGLEVVEPGVVSVSLWRPDPRQPQPAPVDEFCGVARKT